MHCVFAVVSQMEVRLTASHDEHTAILPYTDSCSETGYCDYKQLFHSVTVAAALESMLNCVSVADFAQFQVADVM